ncbi:hypothetical protein [Pantoea sp.]|uniref:hypothetical protein n=1 Tax=Pantoea sp. TaxID=69393 RepID=UPI0029117F0A|nr:hypothetical protein [Pantoea sp.]MDU4127295.1 hypothetical protein [Pantoea sp.]
MSAANKQIVRRFNQQAIVSPLISWFRPALLITPRHPARRMIKRACGRPLR